ncbi:oligosaccharide flippase family protein [Arthrobacter sp. 92]|uniref:oligosaccharide flippase family protein n=1 Tax=Arthrobacter sp. 92 TaxID=3418175 RepID=UPI003CFBF4FC
MVTVGILSAARHFDSTLLPKNSARSPQSGPGAGQTLARSVRRGALWSAGGTIVFRLSNVVVMALVARILVPEQFGVFALAVTVHAFTVSVAELGVAAAIARSDLDLDRIAPTVTTIAVATSILAAAPMAFFAEPLAASLGSANAAQAIRILALGVAMIGPFAVPGAVLQREFRQNALFLATLSGFIPGSALLICLALEGAGVEGLAWSRVLAQLVAGSVMVIATRRIFLPGFDRKVVAPLLAFGVPLALSNLLSQILLNVDNLFIGRLLGVAELGTYTIAFAISVWSTAVIGSMLNSVVLPGLTAVLRQGGGIEVAVLSAVRIVAWVAAPFAAFSIAFARPLISTVYGSQWTGASSLLSALSVYGMVFVLGLLLANIIIATGKTGVLFWVQVVALLALLPALPVGIAWGGTSGAAWTHVAVVTCVTLPVYLFSLRKVTGVRIFAVVRQILPPIAAAMGAATLAWLATSDVESDPAHTIAGLLLGGASYALLTRRTVLEVFPLGSVMGRVRTAGRR